MMRQWGTPRCLITSICPRGARNEEQQAENEERQVGNEAR